MEYIPTPQAEEECVVRAEQLGKRYGNVQALEDVGLTLPRGRVIGLLGPNGSGKSTLIKLIAGLIQPTAGEVRVCGLPIGHESKARVAYLPDRPSLPQHMTVEQTLALLSDFFADFDTEAARAMLEDLGVPMDRRIRHLSKGTKEKVQLVTVMARRATLFLLDEPISGVDPAAREYILRTILTRRSPDATILISTHLIADIEGVMDGFVLLKEGRLHSVGTPEGLLRETGKSVDEYFREVFRC